MQGLHRRMSSASVLLTNSLNILYGNPTLGMRTKQCTDDRAQEIIVNRFAFKLAEYEAAGMALGNRHIRSMSSCICQSKSTPTAASTTV